MQSAYVTAKKDVADVLYLARPLPGATLACCGRLGYACWCCSTTASRWQQLLATAGILFPKLDQAQVHYSAFERELLACYLGIRHFCFFAVGPAIHSPSYWQQTSHVDLCLICRPLDGQSVIDNCHTWRG